MTSHHYRDWQDERATEIIDAEFTEKPKRIASIIAMIYKMLFGSAGAKLAARRSLEAQRR